MKVLLTKTDESTLLGAARFAIASAISVKWSGSEPPPLPVSGIMLENHPVFVTIHQHGDLRGCIGCIRTDDSLISTVQEMAVRAATGDPRFNPMGDNDLQECTISISVLALPKPITGIDQIIVGRHGVIIDGLGRRGLLLPKVAVEQKWTSRQFVEQTCRKAGLQSGAWQQPGVNMYVFETIDFSESDPPPAGTPHGR